MGGLRRFPCMASSHRPSSMASIQFLLCCSLVAILLALPAGAEDPYKFFTWNVTYGDIWPLGVKQQVWLS